MDKEKTFLYAIIVLCFLLLCATISTGLYKNKYDRLVEQHRVELECSRQRAEVLTDTIIRAREEVGAIGESLSRQRTNTAQLRELISEVRTRYENMENLFNSVRRDNSDVCSNDSIIDDSNSEGE